MKSHLLLRTQEQNRISKEYTKSPAIEPPLAAQWLGLHAFIAEGPDLIPGFPGGSEGKAAAHSVGDPGSIPGSGRSSGEINGNPLQYSCLESPMNGEAW